MREAIFTLPLTPKDRPPFFFYLTPFIADVWGKIERKPVFILTNLRGMKYSPIGIRQFEQHIQHLKIRSNIVYDSDYSSYQLQNDCVVLLEKGILTFDYDDILICPCGKVECLPEALSRKEFRVIDNSSYPPKCKVCQGTLQSIRVKTLKWHLGDCPIPECIWYNKALPEVRVKAREVSNQSYLISRLRHSCPGISLEERSIIKIDIDFVWMLFMVNLTNRLGFTTICLPVTFSVYRQVLLFYSLAKQFNPDIKVKLYSLPKLSFKNPTFKDEDLWQFDSLVLRLILTFGLARTKKEIILESNIVHWVNTTLKGIRLTKQTQFEFSDFKDFCLALQEYSLLKVLKSLRSPSADLFSLQMIAAIS